MICCTCIFAKDTQTDSEVKDSKGKVDLVNRDIELGSIFGLVGNENGIDPVVSGSLDFSAEYDKWIKVLIDLDTDKTKVQTDSVSLRFLLNRFSLSADYRKERFFADGVLSSDERILSGKSLIEEKLNVAGYTERAPGVSIFYDGPKSQSVIEQIGFRASYDGTLPVMMNAGCALRVLNNSSWVGLTGTLSEPSNRGYGMGFVHVDSGSFLGSAQLGCGTYHSALNILSINGRLVSSPVWGYTDAGLGFRLSMKEKPCELWILGSYFLPSLALQSSFDGSILVGGKIFVVKSLVLRTFVGIDYSRTQNVTYTKPDLRFSCMMKI